MIEEAQSIIFKVKGDGKACFEIDDTYRDNTSEENLNYRYNMNTIDVLTVISSDVKDVQDSFPWPHRTVTLRRSIQ